MVKQKKKTVRQNQREDEGQGSRGKSIKIASQFRHGVKLCCGQEVWRTIEPWLEEKVLAEDRNKTGEVTQEEKGLHLCLSQSAISKFEKGGMSFEVLVVILSDTKRDYEELVLPTPRRRYIAGYQHAILYIRTKLNGKPKRENPISLLDFVCATQFTLEMDRLENALQKATGTLTAIRQQGIIEWVRSVVAEMLSIPLEEVPYKTYDEFSELLRDLGEEVIPFTHAVRRCWHTWARKNQK